METQPVRILHVLGYFNHGGTESLVMNLFRKIDRSKIMFDFVVHSQTEGFFEKEAKSLGARIHRVPQYKGYNHLNYLKAWKKLFSNNSEYKIVHGHVRSTASLYLKVARQFSLITIAHSHSVSSGSGLSGKVKQFMQRNIIKYSNYNFACSVFAGEWLFGQDAVRKSNFFVMKNAIDAEKYIYDEGIRDSYRNELNVKNKKVIGHIGRFHESKNHERILEIFADVNRTVPEAVLLLIGDGQLLPDIKDKADKLGIRENIVFLGSRSDAAGLYQAMDLFLFPSLYEGLGIAVVEAQASGLPTVVASTIPKEAIYTSFVEMYNLNEENAVWSKAVVSLLQANKRQNVSLKDIIEAGYDIKPTADWYQTFIINLKNKGEI